MITKQTSKNPLPPKTWKEKATTRREKIKQLQKRLKEITISRDSWKVKATRKQAQINELQDEIKQLTKQLQDVKKKFKKCPKNTIIVS